MICPDSKRTAAVGRQSLRLLLLAVFCLACASAALAQDIEDVFDAKPAAKKEAKKDAKKTADSKSAAEIKDRDSISFKQEKVSAQMSELEDRMFRLSEALKSLEPENASRLRLALKFSREELILQQMRETHKLLEAASLQKAETETRELLAKLEHLRDILLAQDLDFQMKLARLRQMRETLGQLDRIVKEERRELAASREAAEDQEQVDKLAEHKETLANLVRKQRQLIRDSQAFVSQDNVTAEQAAPLAAQEQAVREGAAALAEEPTFSKNTPAFLKQADPHLEDALTQLKTPSVSDAVTSEQQALLLLQKELDRLDDQEAKLNDKLQPSNFERFERDQARNRAAAETLASTASRLGDSGVALQKDLIRAGAAMRNAESDLAQTAADPAAEDQNEALKHLVKSHKELAAEMEKLLNELRSELRRQMIADLTEMHEMQKAIRESTESQASGVAQQSRTAIALVVSLAKKEAELAERTEQLTALAEETQFGIALPTALKVIGRQMRQVEGWLGQGQASAQTITLEKRIEEDLVGLLEAMRRLPPTSPPPPGTPLPTQPRQRLRELNRLVAELKMIRLLQTRLNDDTLTVDGSRPEELAVLTPALRREILSLGEHQAEIQTSLGKIAKQVEPPEPSPLEKFDQIQRQLGPTLELR